MSPIFEVDESRDHAGHSLLPLSFIEKMSYLKMMLLALHNVVVPHLVATLRFRPCYYLHCLLEQMVQ